jgi:hypothetical protein
MAPTDYSSSHGTTGAFDFDLHGIVRVRLVDATPREAAVVRRQVGPLDAPPEGQPDITIRFVDRLSPSRPVTFAGWNEGGFTPDAFYALGSKNNVPARTQLVLEELGGPTVVTCERSASAVPLLIAMINSVALAKGVLPLHASAFDVRGTGVLTTGWSKGGKTESLLAFMTRGARYVADEWTYLCPDGRMLGIPEPIRVWSWQLDQLPELRARVPASRLRALRALGAAAAAAGVAAKSPRGAQVARRAAPVLKRQMYAQVPPAELFGADAIALEGRLDHVFLMLSHDSPEIAVEQIDGADVAARMRWSLQEERAPLMAMYRQYGFAFPGAASPLLDRAEEVEGELLDHVLGSRPAYAVRHPYPVRISDLHDAMSPYISPLTDVSGRAAPAV